MKDGELLVEVQIVHDEDVILARQKVRQFAQDIGFSMLDQTRLITAVSELARNIVVHAGGAGSMTAWYAETTSGQKGVRILFADKGPGIPDVDLALREGFSTAGSLGLGLNGAKRLVDDFEISTGTGDGTSITIIKWV
jgi:serine/threonine-protein kinase RsbT